MTTLSDAGISWAYLMVTVAHVDHKDVGRRGCQLDVGRTYLSTCWKLWHVRAVGYHCVSRDFAILILAGFT